MPDPALDILVVSDLHYTPGEDPLRTACADRYTALGPLLLRKAALRLRHLGARPDLLVLLGDLLDDGSRPETEAALNTLAREAAATGLPVLALPGNHDPEPARVARAFDCAPGLHEHGGYGFVIFHDQVGAGDVTTRPACELERLRSLARSRPGLPLVALQHNPVFPDIVCQDYPYMPVNVDEIRRAYADVGLLLSLSGHYHYGQELARHAGVAYHTVRAASVPPFCFSLVRLRGREAKVEQLQLTLDAAGIEDTHCHTQFAYCAGDVDAAWNVALARLLGLERVCLVEHAFHLYFRKDTAWSYRWQEDTGLVTAALQGPRARMRAYRRLVEPLRVSGVGLGLEVDTCATGGLLLAAADRHGWDLLVGAVHNIPGSKGKTQSWAEGAFMEATARVLAQPVQVLAHPLRWFKRAGFKRPPRLYEPLADLLAAAGVAAEINFHTNTPDPAFLRACRARGVRLACGSDAHDLAEVGEFYPHLRLLRRLEAEARGDEARAAAARRPRSRK